MPSFTDMGLPLGTYYKAADLPPTGLVLTIARAFVAELPNENGIDRKPALGFLEQGSAQLVLNKTNRSTCEAAFGQETVAAAFLAPQVPFDPLKPHDNLAQQRDGVGGSEKRAGGGSSASQRPQAETV